MNLGVPTLEARARHEDCLSDLSLDRLIGGEISDGAERGAIEAHLATCALCLRRRHEIESAPVQAPDPAWLRQRRPSPPRRPVALAGGALALAAAAAFVLVVRAKPPATTETPGDAPATAAGSAQTATATATTRTKGAALALDLFVRRDDRAAEPVFADVPLRAGDAIRFRVRAPQDGYLTILGLDAEGKVSRYAPARGTPVALFTAGEGVVDGSVILDDAPGEEKVIALLCPDAAAAERSIVDARDALAAAGAPARVARLPGPCQQASASFRKAARR